MKLQQLLYFKGTSFDFSNILGCSRIYYGQCNYSKFNYKGIICIRKVLLPGLSSQIHLTSSSGKLSSKIEDVKPKETKLEKILKIVPGKRNKKDGNNFSVERNFITAVRAMNDFLLRPEHMENLRKAKRRSPYANEPPITVYWFKDVKEKAMEVWGSKQALENEKRIRLEQLRQHQEDYFQVKTLLKEYKGRETVAEEDNLSGFKNRSGKVVLVAVGINTCNFLLKLFAWLYTGSHSMFAEAIHSFADTMNQLILAYGIHKSTKRANQDHPYGYFHMTHVASLVSGVGIFCVGAGLSFYHGITGIIHPQPVESFYWAYFVLCGSFISEGASVLVAYNALKKSAAEHNMKFLQYVYRSQDPLVSVVFCEDVAALLGVGIAASCMGLTSFLGSPYPDAAGSLIVGGLLASVASFIIYSNSVTLVGRSIPAENIDKINEELEQDVIIRAIHDVKGIDMGNHLVRYKAEVDIDGRELSRSYLESQDLELLLQECRNMKNIDDVEVFLLKHGENIVDLLGAEIDRIEKQLKKSHPEIRHCDLEVL